MSDVWTYAVECEPVADWLYYVCVRSWCRVPRSSDTTSAAESASAVTTRSSITISIAPFNSPHYTISLAKSFTDAAVTDCAYCIVISPQLQSRIYTGP